MTFYRYVDGVPVECGGREVACTTPGCRNEGAVLEVADDPEGCVLCGPCGQWIIPPPPEEPDEPVEPDEPEEEPWAE